MAFRTKLDCIARFNLLFDAVVEFLQGCDPGLAQEVMLSRNDSAYLSDIFAEFNEVNLSLQINEVNLIQGKVGTVWIQ